jgi:hypothetical protein
MGAIDVDSARSRPLMLELMSRECFRRKYEHGLNFTHATRLFVEHIITIQYSVECN